MVRPSFRRVSRGTTASSLILSSSSLSKMLGSKNGLFELWDGLDEYGDKSPSSISDASRDSKDLGDHGVFGVLHPDRF